VHKSIELMWVEICSVVVAVVLHIFWVMSEMLLISFL